MESAKTFISNLEEYDEKSIPISLEPFRIMSRLDEKNGKCTIQYVGGNSETMSTVEVFKKIEIMRSSVGSSRIVLIHTEVGVFVYILRTPAREN